jgi:hypothetical protein
VPREIVPSAATGHHAETLFTMQSDPVSAVDHTMLCPVEVTANSERATIRPPSTSGATADEILLVQSRN